MGTDTAAAGPEAGASGSGPRSCRRLGGFGRLGREVGEDDSIVGPQGRGHRLPYPARLDRFVAAHLGVDPLRLVEEAGVHREPIRPFADPLPARLDPPAMPGAAPLETPL